VAPRTHTSESLIRCTPTSLRPPCCSPRSLPEGWRPSRAQPDSTHRHGRRRRDRHAVAEDRPAVGNVGVVLRLGNTSACRGLASFGSFRLWIRCHPGSISGTITTSFAAEQTLTSDTVPVNVDACCFWLVHDAQKAALEVQDYQQAVSWAAQTGLRDIIGRTALTELPARPRANRNRAAAAHRRPLEPVGASPCSRSRCATSSFPARCRMRCPAKRRPLARSRRASSSARRKWRSRIHFRKRQSRTCTFPWRFIFAR